MASDGAGRGWSHVPIRDVVYFQEGPGLRNWQYRDAGIPFVNIRCLKDGRLLRSEMTCLDPEEVEAKYKHFLLDEGDYVVSSSGTLGRIAEVFSEDLPCMLNTSVIRFRPLDERRLDRRFLKVFLRSDLFNEQILAHANGSAQLNYGPTHLKQMMMPLPPISEQTSIGEILGSLDERIDNLRQTNATLEAIAQALFKSWFVDFDPVRAKAEGREPEGMDAATAALFPSEFEDSEIGPIPKGWRVSAIGDRANVVDCLHAKKPELLTEGRPYLQLNCIREDGLLETTAAARITENDYEKWTSRMEARPGDCVITNVGRVGAVAQVPAGFKAAIGRNMTGIRPKDGFPPTFLIELLMSDYMRREIEQKTDAGTILNALNVKNIPKLRFVCASEDVLKRFEGVARQLRLAMEANLQRCSLLADLRDTLLPRLISGKLRLPEAESMLKEAIA
jgi:type I restriction enzyme, S subunit